MFATLCQKKMVWAEFEERYEKEWKLDFLGELNAPRPYWLKVFYLYFFPKSVVHFFYRLVLQW